MIFIDLLLFSVVLFGLIVSLKDMKKGQLTWNDFKKYEMITILTNKRWIQKDLGILKLNTKTTQKK